ncbi:MAG TPA: adenylate/guanylate cyclase domain-containing protein [Elainellaceae cyanobacterium]
MFSSAIALPPPRFWRYLLRVAGFAAVHFGIARLVFLIPIGNLDVWPLWVSAGFTQAVLLYWGCRFFPGILIGTFLVGVSSGLHWLLASLFALNDVVQAVLGVTLLKRSGFQRELGRLSDVVALFALSAIIPSAVSATVGTFHLGWSGMIPWAAYDENWFTWWIGNLTGILTLMPVLLTLRQWRAIAQYPERRIEILMWLLTSAGISWFLFCSVRRMDIAPYPLEYVPFPFLIWGALRLGQPGAALSTALITNIATLGVVLDRGPFIANAQTVSQAVLSLQAYICVIALTGLTLAAVMTEREEARVSLQHEKERSEQLLLNILPLPIANQLKQERRTIADSFAEVTVLFADIANFTRLSATLSAQELVALLNEIFSAFDDMADKYGLEKIKTIGDAYMVVGGLPFPLENHVEAIADMAIEMQAAMVRFSQIHQKPLAMRIGINTGPVVAGVIGTRKFIYDLWGDTVNTASRMESQGIVGQIQVTDETYERLRDRYEFQKRGTIDIKGKDEMVTYILVGRKAIARQPEELLES